MKKPFSIIVLLLCAGVFTATADCASPYIPDAATKTPATISHPVADVFSERHYRE
ncbi:MAG: hypothetical protein LBU24_04630 [Methanocalculaceae archaeon]|jgi:hypothetical protein|nr:hypothetical protein [Methanocalculaceae archaeon]